MGTSVCVWGGSRHVTALSAGFSLVPTVHTSTDQHQLPL